MNDLQILGIAILLVLNIINTCAIGFMIHSDLNVIYKRLENFLK